MRYWSFFYTASIDYNSISVEEIVFTSGQSVNDIQCTAITILDDSNVLENPESFIVSVSTADVFVIVLSPQDNIVININEDPLDGSFVQSKLRACTYMTYPRRIAKILVRVPWGLQLFEHMIISKS